MRRILPVLAMISIAACSDPPAEPDSGPTSLVANLSVEPKTATNGGSMSIRLTISHSGRGATSFFVFEDGHSFNPIVKDAAGKIVWTANAGRELVQARREVVLTNGEVFTAELVWPLTDSQGAPLVAGAYTLTSELDAEPLAPGFTEITMPIVIKGSG